MSFARVPCLPLCRSLQGWGGGLPEPQGLRVGERGSPQGGAHVRLMWGKACGPQVSSDLP